MNKITDSDKLRFLANWFDMKDRNDGNDNNEVQTDLRRIADQLEDRCTCKDECPYACKGECGCKSCHDAYQDFLAAE